jgi:hypothetical protein
MRMPVVPLFRAEQLAGVLCQYTSNEAKPAPNAAPDIPTHCKLAPNAASDMLTHCSANAPLSRTTRGVITGEFRDLRGLAEAIGTAEVQGVIRALGMAGEAEDAIDFWREEFVVE